MKLCIVIPAFNESQTIFRVIKQIDALCLRQDFEFEILVIDDGSLDATYYEAKKAGATVLRHSINRGQGAALATGNEYALNHDADMIVHFDADGQHSAEDIISLIQPLINKKVDVVLGSRFIITKSTESTKIQKANNNKKKKSVLLTVYGLLVNTHIPLLRRVLILGSLMVNTLLTGELLTDAHNGLRALTASALKKMNLQQDRMAHNTEYIHEIKRLNLRIQEALVTIVYHQNIKRSQNFFDGIRILKELFLGKIIR